MNEHNDVLDFRFWILDFGLRRTSSIQSLQSKIQNLTVSFRRTGQSTIEYLLVLVAIVLALIYAVRPTGPLQQAVANMVDQTGNTVEGLVNEAAAKF